MKLALTLRSRKRLLSRLLLGEALARPGEGPLARLDEQAFDETRPQVAEDPTPQAREDRGG